MKKRNFILSILLAAPMLMFAQGNIDEILKGTAADAKLLTEGYASPMLKAFGSGLNQGWYNTAKVHKFPGVDITFTVSQVNVPTSDQFYEVDNTKLSNSIKLETAHNGQSVGVTGKGMMPTLFGPDNTPSAYRLYAPTTPPTAIPGNAGQIPGPPGIGLKYLPVPIANIGIGLPKGFDIKFRYVPTIDLSNLSSDITGEFNLFGVGVMHDVKQYIPGIKMLPFDLSAFAGYTTMKLDVGFNTNRPDQRGTFKSTATTIQALISKKFSVLTVYGGVGYNIASTTLQVQGNYDLDDNVVTPDQKLDFKIDGSASGPRATAGVRLKLAILTLHADYTLQEYKTLSVGVGLSVRN